jgi:hypothetical protein
VAPDPKPDEWFNEFKKLNTQGTEPSVPPANEASPGQNEPSTAQGSDRRVHNRFEVDQASAHLYKDGLFAFIGVGKGTNLARAAIDVSESGAQLMIHERLSPGTKVRLKIAVEKYKEVIETTGIVRWCYQSAKKKQDFFVGVEFLAMDAAQARKLAAMRDWFTSPQYKAIRQGRLRPKDKPPEIRFPKK